VETISQSLRAAETTLYPKLLEFSMNKKAQTTFVGYEPLPNALVVCQFTNEWGEYTVYCGQFITPKVQVANCTRPLKPTIA
jgi:hypothetical protein